MSTINLNENHIQYAVILTGLFHLISTIIGTELIEKFGRKTLIIFSKLSIIITFSALTLFINVSIQFITYLNSICINIKLIYIF